jgi:hypothetical protein
MPGRASVPARLQDDEQSHSRLYAFLLPDCQKELSHVRRRIRRAPFRGSDGMHLSDLCCAF